MHACDDGFHMYNEGCQGWWRQPSHMDRVRIYSCFTLLILHNTEIISAFYYALSTSLKTGQDLPTSWFLNV